MALTHAKRPDCFLKCAADVERFSVTGTLAHRAVGMEVAYSTFNTTQRTWSRRGAADLLHMCRGMDDELPKE